MGRHLVVGATGGFGGAALRQLCAAGEPVRVLVRSRAKLKLPAGAADQVEVVEGDASVLSLLLDAAKDCESIFSGLCVPFPRWIPGFQQLHDNVVEASGLTGATLVLPGRVLACRPIYGVPQPPQLHTSMHLDGVGPYGRMLQGMEAQMEQNCSLRGVRALVVRAGSLFGEGVDNPLMREMIRAARAGQPILWPGDPESMHLFSWSDDVARAALRLLREGGGSPFTVWNVPGHALTGPEWAAALGAAAGKGALPVQARRGWMLKLAAMFREPEAWAMGEREAWEGPLLLDDRPTLAALPGFRLAPIAEALQSVFGGASGALRQGAA